MRRHHAHELHDATLLQLDGVLTLSLALRLTYEAAAPVEGQVGLARLHWQRRQRLDFALLEEHLDGVLLGHAVEPLEHLLFRIWVKQ